MTADLLGALGAIDQTIGENRLWDFPKPQISSTPWTYREHRQKSLWTDDVETTWVVLDANSKSVAEFDRGFDAERVVYAVNSMVLGPGSTGYNEGTDAAIDWARYPKLREVFENRPRENDMWIELANLARDLSRKP